MQIIKSNRTKERNKQISDEMSSTCSTVDWYSPWRWVTAVHRWCEEHFDYLPNVDIFWVFGGILLESAFFGLTDGDGDDDDDDDDAFDDAFDDETVDETSGLVWEWVIFVETEVEVGVVGGATCCEGVDMMDDDDTGDGSKKIH